jgi:pimeloyl-ACP methyl ester carboxylesterase
MGDLSDRATLSPQAIEWSLPQSQIIRGIRWGKGPDTALLLHEPGTDLDAWMTLPAEIARQLEIETVAIDLPGHGLSDDPWDPAQLPDLMRHLPSLAPAASRRFLIAGGTPAIAALEQSPAVDLAGLVCLSPVIPEEGRNPPRSPRLPKLFVAGSLAGNDLNDARRLAKACGGWSVVTALPVAERGTGLLASAWGVQLVEQIVTFLRDCQRRPPLANHASARRRSESSPAPHDRSPFPSAQGEGQG